MLFSGFIIFFLSSGPWNCIFPGSEFKLKPVAGQVQNMFYLNTRGNRSAYVCPLTRCILAKDTNAMKRVLRKLKKKQTQLQADSKGWTALHVAASKDEYADCLKLLLSNKDLLGLNLDAKTLTGKTAFFLACMEGCVKNCRFLLESRCNPEIPDSHGCTPLHIASKFGHADIISQLIAHGLNTNYLDSDGNTALHYASAKGDLEVVRVLMTSKRTQVNIRTNTGYLPLHSACTKGSLEIVRILVEADRSLVNCCSRDNGTPLIIVMQNLMIVPKKGHVECVKYLLHQGANVNCCTIDHVTTLCYAAQIGVREILSLVLQGINHEYIRKQLMLHIQGVLSDRWGAFHSLMSHVMNSSSPECMSLLLESGIPMSILEAPYFSHQYEDVRDVYSPLAYLFSKVISFSRDEFDEFLELLLQHNITHLYEFSQMVKLKAAHAWTAPLTVRYVHPFTNIFRGPWSPMQRDHYLNKLFDYGITTDYCLQCDVHYDSRFLDFDMDVLKHFYKPVVWAIKEDKAEVVELLLGNSAILEPSHLWNFLQHQRSVKMKRMNPQNVINYLIDLEVVFDTSNLPSYPFGGTIKCSNLQQLCRQVIRKHLRDVTLQDNLKNFKQKINALSLPNLLKNFLQFK